MPKKLLDSPEAVREKALSLLAKREYNTHLLSQKLRQAGAEEQDIHALIDAFVEKKWLDDTRYCDIFVRSQVSKGHGIYRIKQEAQLKGIAEIDLNLCIEALDIDWFQLAADAYNKRFFEKPIDSPKEKAKRFRYLQYRGFSSEQIACAMEQSDDLSDD